MYERWLLGNAPAIAVPSGRARANGTRASAHVTFQRTTSERKLCFSAKLRRQRCCLAERCLQGILPACRPIHCPRLGARASKKRTRVSAHIKWLFSTKQVISPVLTSATGAAFLVCARKQRGGPRSRTPFSSPVTPPGNSHIVQPRRQPGDGSAEKKREIPTKRTGETGQHSRLQRSCCPVWALQHICV